MTLKDEDIWLLSNREAAKKNRLDSLRRKFAKDDRLFKEYEKFMEALMEKGYGRKCDDKGSDGKT